MTLTHSDACLEVQRRVEEAQQKYREQYPQYCHNCFGTGLVDDSDWSVGLVGAAICETCVWNGRCPRCSYTMDLLTQDPDDPNSEISQFAEHQRPCSRCGLIIGGEQYFGLPEPFTLEGPCECEIAAWEKGEM